MVSQKVIIKNKLGLHARPAGIFAKKCEGMPCEVFLAKNDGKKINAKSILSILAACIKCGCEIEIFCDGKNEIQSLKELVKLVETNLLD